MVAEMRSAMYPPKESEIETWLTYHVLPRRKQPMLSVARMCVW